MGNKNSTNSRAGAGDRSNNRAQEGSNEVQSKIDRERYGAGVAYGSGKITKERVNKTEMYGGKASKYTNQFIAKQPASSGLYATTSGGNMIKDSSGNPILTRKGYNLKYGNTGAMGIGDRNSIMGSVPISEAMFESQRKTKAIMLGGLSVFAGPVVGSVMRVGAADALYSNYDDYRKSFSANMSSNKFDSPSAQNTETANKGMGTTENNTSTKTKSKTTKSTTKYLAGTGMDVSTKKRFFLGGNR